MKNITLTPLKSTLLLTAFVSLTAVTAWSLYHKFNLPNDAKAEIAQKSSIPINREYSVREYPVREYSQQELIEPELVSIEAPLTDVIPEVTYLSTDIATDIATDINSEIALLELEIVEQEKTVIIPDEPLAEAETEYLTETSTEAVADVTTTTLDEPVFDDITDSLNHRVSSYDAASDAPSATKDVAEDVAPVIERSADYANQYGKPSANQYDYNNSSDSDIHYPGEPLQNYQEESTEQFIEQSNQPNFEQSSYESTNQSSLQSIEQYLKPKKAPPSYKKPSYGSNSSFRNKLANQAERRLQSSVNYDGRYVKIAYPMGDVPSHMGVCTDVIVRAYRGLGIDLQQRVHEDMKRNFSRYPNNWNLRKPDTNIDHRRVPNLMAYFERKGAALPVTKNPIDYVAGDIVTWNLNNGMTHIGIVSQHVSKETGNPLIVHNIGVGPEMTDMLFKHKITGHYNYGGARANGFASR